MREIPKPGEFYRHFKGMKYQIISTAVHSETSENLVIYQALYDDFKVYARPIDMFLSKVDHSKYPKAEQRYRFERFFPEQMSNNEAGREQIIDDVVTNEVTNEEKSNCSNILVDSTIEEVQCNPDLLAFLDADTFEEKRNLLISMRKRMDDRLINDIAASIDVTVDDGDIDTRFKSLMFCVNKRLEFDTGRLR